MTQHVTNLTGNAAPSLFITTNKQRVKQYGRSVYLNNGEEFELELFNPTQTKVLAKITINGNSLGAGIILRPGERVFLERYLDEAKKFEFSTYFVDGGSKAVQQAIKENGKVEVEFYEEYTPPQITYFTNTIQYTDNSVPYTWTTGDSASINLTAGNAENISFTSSTNVGMGTSTPSASLEVNNGTKSKSLKRSVKETGRVEKGADSDQVLEYANDQFNVWFTWSDTWTIFPKSEKKVYTKEEIAVYCTSCGAKRKKTSHKFCPHCGSKF